MSATPETPREKGKEGDAPQVVPPVNEQPVAPPADPQQPATPPTQPPKVETPAKPDFEKLYKESSSEALTQKARADAAEAQLQGLTKEPTDSELRAAFPEWDVMSDAEKASASRAFNAERIAQGLKAERDAEKAEKNRASNVDAAIASHPDLEGKEQAFRDFCAKPTHRTVDPTILVDAFLHKASATAPAPPTPSPGLESGNGGPRTPEKPKKISIEEAAEIRKMDYRRYLKLVKAGEIEEL